MNNEQPLGGIAQAPRTSWADFPDAVIHQSIPTVQGHPQYAAAKSGDVSAAQRLVDATLNGDAVARIAAAVGGRPSIMLPVYAEEAQGINRIPMAMPEALEAPLGALRLARVAPAIPLIDAHSCSLQRALRGLFAFIGFPHAENMAIRATRGVAHHNHPPRQQAVADDARFVVVLAGIFNLKRDTRKD